MTSDVVLSWLPFSSFLPSRFERTIDDTTYRLDASGTQLAVACAAFAVMILLVLALVARRRQGAIVSPFVPLAIAATLASVVGAVFSLRRYGSGRSAAGVFRSALQIDVVAAAVAVGVVVGATLILLLRERGQLALVPLFVPTVLAAGAGALVAEKHLRSIFDVGALPVFALEGSIEMHVGHDREVSVDLVGPARSRQVLFWRERCDPCKLDTATRAKWTAPTKVHVDATAAGRVPFSAVARRGPVSLETTLHVLARHELASPLLSLRVGDRFTYRSHARFTDGAVLYFVTLAGGERVDVLTIEVTGTRERDGFRTFVLEIHDGIDVSEVEVVAVDGTTRFFDHRSGRPGAEIISFAGDASAPDPVKCRFALLSADALCQRGGRDADVPTPAEVDEPRKRGRAASVRPPVAFAGAAPATFERHASDTASTVVTGFLAIVTAGLVILPDGSSSRSFTLVATSRGPDGAPEAPASS